MPEAQADDTGSGELKIHDIMLYVQLNSLMISVIGIIQAYVVISYMS